MNDRIPSEARPQSGVKACSLGSRRKAIPGGERSSDGQWRNWTSGAGSSVAEASLRRWNSLVVFRKATVHVEVGILE